MFNKAAGRRIQICPINREPSLCVVGGVTGEVYPKERRHSDDQQERREELEVLAFDVKRDNSQKHTDAQQADVFDDRRGIASSFVGQLGRGRKYLYDADETKEEKHHPDDFVTLEYVSKFLVVHLLSLLKGRSKIPPAHILYRLLTCCLNCSPRSSMLWKRSKLAQQGESKTVSPGRAMS